MKTAAKRVEANLGETDGSAGGTASTIVREVATPSGARATALGEVLAIRTKDGATIASYDAATGELRLTASADLVLSAPNGRVRLEGAEGARIESRSSAIDVDETITLRSLRLAITNTDTSLDVERATLNASAADMAIGQLSLRAERVIERVGDVYRTVDGLLETRAKRLRTVVASTLELFGRRTTIQSEKDTRIDGERVLLG